jgi:CMP-N,N'-diacetyllegionaminic acid synthase
VPSAIALIGARGGSERVPGKNVRRLAGHPLLAYAIATARESRLFDRILVSTDSKEIADVARWYGADVPFLRPAELATSTSPDIEWIAWTLPQLEERYELFAIVRATNPFRGSDVLRRGMAQLVATPEADSIRAVELVKQHPGKMWAIAEDGRLMTPILEQGHLDVAWHAGQFPALPPVYVQNSALEIAWTRVVEETGTREGRVVAPFLTRGLEGLNIDDEEDFARAEALVASGTGVLPSIDIGPPPPPIDRPEE